MADFTLVVGANVTLSYEQMRSDLDEVVKQLNAKPLQVKVEFDKSSLQSMRSEIENIHKSIMTGATKVPVDTTGIAKVSEQARQATGAVQNMNKAMSSTSAAAKSAAEAERQLKKIADAATQARALLNKNMEASGSSSYQKLNAELTKLEAILQSCGGDSTKLSATLKNAGIDGESAVNRLNTAMATLKNELQTAGTQGTVSLRRIIETYTQMQALLNSNPQMMGTAQFEALSAQVEMFRSVIEACGGDASMLETALHSAGLNGASAIETAKTSMASFKAEIASTTAAEGRKAAAAKSAAEAERQHDEALREGDAALNKYNSSIIVAEKRLLDWSAAENSKNASSRASYVALQNAISRVNDAATAYNSSGGRTVANAEALRKANAELNNQLKETERTLRANGDATKSLSDRFSGLAKKFGAWLSVTQVIMFAVRSVRQMVKASVELDSAMTQMQIVTKASASNMEAFGDAAAKVAKRTASTITDVVDSATTYARLGYTMGESTQLAEFTAMLQNVGNIDVSDAQDAITSIIKAYDIDASQIESVMDKLVEVGNHFPISVSQIAEGMTNASSTLHAAGNSFEHSVALLTAANTTIQDAAKSSTGLRTIAARIRNTKTELDDLGEVMTEASYEELVQTLTDCGVALTDINGEYRSTYDIMSDIAAKWETLDSMRRAALATALSGTRQQAVFYSIIENFQEASGAMESMADSAGALSEAYDVYLNSAQAHIDQFKASFQELSANIIGSDLIKWVVDFGTNILDLVNRVVQVVEKLGGLKTVLLTLASVLLISKSAWVAHTAAMITSTVVSNVLSGFSKIVAGIRSVINIIPVAIAAWKGYTAGTVSASAAMQAFIPVIGLVLAAVTLLIGAFSLYNNEVNETRQKSLEAADSASSLSTEISNLTYEYLSLSSAVEEDQSVKEQLISVQDELIDKLDIEKSRIQELTKEYGSYNDAIKAASLEKLRESERDIRAGVAASKDEALSIVDDYLWNVGSAINGQSTIKVYGVEVGRGSEKSQRAQEKLYQAGVALEDAGFTIAAESTYTTAKAKDWGFTSGIGIDITGDTSTVEGITEMIVQLGDALDIIQDTAGSDSDFYQNVYEVYNGLKTSVSAYNDKVEQLNDNLAKQYAIQGLIGKELPSTSDEFEQYRQSVIDAAIASGDFVGTNEDISSAVDGFLQSQVQFAQFYKRTVDDGVKSTRDVTSVTEKALGSLIHYRSDLVRGFNQGPDELSNEDFAIASKLVDRGEYKSWGDLIGAIGRYKTTLEYTADKARESLSSLWNSEGFEKTKESVIALANSVDGISDQQIEELAASSAELASLLEIDGINAKFLARILQTEALGGDGFALITEDALILNQALEGMTRRFGEVAEAKSRYDAAMSVPEKDTDFRSMAGAFKELNDQFVAGTTNSNAFWAAAEFLFGTEQLDAWGWEDGLEDIYAAMRRNVGVFEDADSAGAGFLERLNEIAEGGQVLGEDGSVIATIEKFADGSFEFDVDALHLSELAEQMGMSKEAVMSCLEALSMWGDIDYYDIQEVLGAIKEIGLSSDNFDGVAVNVSALTDQLISLGYTNKDIHDILTDLQAVDGVTLVDVNAGVSSLVDNLTNLGIAASENGTVVIDVQGLANLASDLGMTQGEAETLITKLYEADGITMTNANGEVTSLDDALAALDGKTFTSVTSELDGIASSAQNAETAVQSLQKRINGLTGNTVTITVNEVRRSSILSGITAYASGTSNAPAGDAVVGEDGEELVVHKDSAYVAGSHGAEIAHLESGDKVYTADETKRILSSAKQIRGVIPAYSGGSPGRAGGKIGFVGWGSVIGGSGGGSSSGGGSGSGGSSSRGSGTGSSSGHSTSTSTSKDEESWFEKQYKLHNHLIKMCQEDMANYLTWLNTAYRKAYDEGIIDLDDYRKYQEEVYKGLQDLFKDYLSDVEHEIDMRSMFEGETSNILALYRQLIKDVEKEIAAARAAGLDDTDDYIQELQKKWSEYGKSVREIEEDARDGAKDAVDELIQYRIKMLKQEADKEKDSLKKKLDNLKEFYNKQKEMLQDVYDEEKYLDEQSEKRKSVTDIQAELAQLEFDDSAWAQKRKLQLQQELADAQKELEDFEKQHALDEALGLLDDAYDAQEKEINAEMEALEEKLNDPEALYNQALADIRNNTEKLYQEMLEYNRRYGLTNGSYAK